MTVSISIPRRLAERVRKEAEKLGIGLEEYIVELLVQELDPRDRAIEYIEAAKELLERAREELARDDTRQASEKTWGAAALAVKAYAWWRERRRLASHRELWKYTKIMAEELGKWVSGCWNQANAMHICFYEGWCMKEHVEAALEQVEKLVNEVYKRIRKTH